MDEPQPQMTLMVAFLFLVHMCNKEPSVPYRDET